MNIQIANVLGIVAADFTIDEITIICGKNFQAKSSIALAVGACLTGETLPDGLKKKDVQLLIHDGAQKAMVVIEEHGNSNIIKYPQAVLTTVGEPLSASKIAVGFQSVLDMKLKTSSGDLPSRHEYFATFLNSEPTREALWELIKETGINEEVFGQMWEEIRGLGWNAVFEIWKQKGTVLTGEWAHITGEKKYGKIKGENFVPGGWDADLLNANLEDLEQAVSQANESLNSARTDVAVSDNEVERLTELAGKVEELNEEHKKAFENTIKVNGELQELKDKDKYREQPESQLCPHSDCKKPVRIKDGRIVQADKPLTKVAQKKLLDIHNELITAISDKEQEYLEANESSNHVYALLTEANNAETRLTEIKSAKPSTTNLSDTQKKYDTAQRRLTAFNIHREAYAVHRKIQNMAIIVSALSSDGLRLTVLNKSIKSVNAELKQLAPGCPAWKITEFDKDLNVRYGGRPIFISKSEKFMANVTIQLMIARREKSIICIIDEAEILDTAGRNELIKIVRRAGVPTLILMMMNEIGDVPDMSSLIGGRAYWLIEGVLTEVRADKHEAA